ncbi:MAG: signal peptidase I [Chloroflexi bacterium HGW-Chloroflexi-9]|nr:MAG: signal peptidase I [Chloroflexi bacterium HGW-Chloroflexi-9]
MLDTMQSPARSMASRFNPAGAPHWFALGGRLARYLLFVVSSVVTFVTLLAFSATALGYDLFVVTGGSMAPAVPAGALVIAERVPPSALNPGDVITFRRTDSPSTPVTHRVIRVEGEGAALQVWTQGDANATADAEPLRGDHLVSTARLTVPLAGHVLSFLRTLQGQILLIVFPIVGLAGSSLLRMAGTGAPVDAAPGAVEGGTPGRSLRRLLSVRVPAFPRTVRMERPRLPSAGGLRDRLSQSTRFSQNIGAQGVQGAGQAERIQAGSDLSTLPRRARRMDEAVLAIGQLSDSFATSVKQELEPVEGLARDLSEREREFEVSLARSLQPLTDYADQIEANLETLIQRLGAGPSVLEGPFQQQIADERARVRKVRAAIEESKTPVRRALRREAEALDAMLTPLDGDIDSIDALLGQMRRHMVQVLARLRSDQFAEAVSLMQQRSGELRVLAEMGETRELEIRATLSVGADEHPGERSAFVAGALSVMEGDGDTAPTAARSRSSAA